MNNKDLELLVSTYLKNRANIASLLINPESPAHKAWFDFKLSHPYSDPSDLYSTLAATATAVDLFREMLPFQTSLEHLYPKSNPPPPTHS